jgi:hypothetical protein
VDLSAHSLSFLNPNPYPKGRDMLLFLPVLFPCSEVPSFFSEVPTVGLQSAEISKVGNSKIFLGGFEL